jgi:hypothetical protein
MYSTLSAIATTASVVGRKETRFMQKHVATERIVRAFAQAGFYDAAAIKLERGRFGIGWELNANLSLRGKFTRIWRSAFTLESLVKKVEAEYGV